MNPGPDAGIRAAGWAGLSIAPLCLAILPLTGNFPHLFPVVAQSDASIAAWYHRHDIADLVQVMAVDIGVMLAIPFSFGLARAIGIPPRSDRKWLVVIPFTLMAGNYVMANSLWLTAHRMAADPARWAAMRAFMEGAIAVLFATSAPLAFALGFAGHHILRSRLFPRWIAWYAFVAGGVNLAADFLILVRRGWAAPMGPAACLPYVLLFSWVVTTSIMMIRSARFADGSR